MQPSTVYQLSSEKQNSYYASLPAVLNPLPPSMDQEGFEKQLCIQYEKYRNFSVTKRKTSRATTESTLFAISKDEWNTKEGTCRKLEGQEGCSPLVKDWDTLIEQSVTQVSEAHRIIVKQVEFMKQIRTVRHSFNPT